MGHHWRARRRHHGGGHHDYGPHDYGHHDYGHHDYGHHGRRHHGCRSGCGHGRGLPCAHLGLLSTLLLAVAAAAPRKTQAGDRLGLSLIRGYQRWLSHRLPITCPYTPSCSNYGLTAISQFGLREGSQLTAQRLRRCTAEVTPATTDPVPALPA